MKKINPLTPAKPLTLFLLLLYLCCFDAKAQTAKGALMESQTEKFDGDIHALIIGISKYANYPSLQFADRDALAFYNLLLSDAFGADINRITILLNEQATQNRVDEALSNLLSFVKEGDRVFIHFSGHGGVEGLTTLRRGFLLTHETSPSNLRLSSYRIDDLNAIVGELATANKAQVFLVMDACHSGKVDEAQHKGISPVTEYLTRISYGTSFLSSGPDELSLEGNQWGGGRGLFSYHLVNGLAGKADMDEDGKVDLNEISFYVKNRVKKEADPNPQNPIINGKENTISMASSAFLNTIQDSKTAPAQLAMRDVSSKGYEQLFLEKLSNVQIQFYSSFMQALDKSECKGNSCTDFSDAKTYFNKLTDSEIPSGLEVILRRKFIASLQDKPQQLLDILISGKKASSNESEVCQLADNLKHSASLMGKDHYLFDITMAKHYYFKSHCFSFKDSYENDENLKQMCLLASDSAIIYSDNIGLFYINRGNALLYLKRYEEAIAMYDRAIALKPDDASYFNKGNALRNMNRFEEAIAMYDRAIALDPVDADYYNNKGIALDDLKRYEEAIEMYDRAIALKPDDAKAYNNKGNVLQNLNRYEEAIEMFDKAIALKPDGVIYFNKGNALRKLNRYEEAIAMYDRAIALKPEDADYYNNKGIALWKQNRYEEAIEMYDRAIALEPDDANYYNGKGIALDDLKRYEEAIALYDRAIALKPDNASYYNNKGIALRNLNRYEEAIAMYDRAIALKPDNASYYNNKGTALYNLNRYEEAIEIYNRAIALKPNDAEAYNNKGIALRNLNRYEEAIEMYDRAIALKPEDADYYNNKGIALWKQNRYEEAIEIYDRAIALKPDEAIYYNNKGNALYNLNRYEEAIEMYDRAIALKPDYASYYNGKGIALGNLNRFEEAIAMYDMAIALKPDDANYYNNKGIALRNLNRYEEAIAIYDRAIALMPDDADYYNNKGIALWNLNRYEEALDIYKHCIEINPKAKDGYLYNIGCAYSLMGQTEKALLYLEQALQSGYKNFEWIEKDSDWDNIKETNEFKALIGKYKNKH
jgi:tetratricopeptide (TPR) repeat protein